MPVGHEDVQADHSGFRGFVVEFYNIISDIVVQDGFQSILNLKVVTLLSHTHIHKHTTHAHTPPPRWC